MTRPLVGLFKGQSQYGAVRAHVDDLAAAFAAEGVEPFVIDLDGPRAEQLMSLYTRSREVGIAFVHGMVGWGADARAEGHSFFDLLGCPYIHHMQDPPYFFHERLLERPRVHKIAVHDSAYESYLARIPGLTPDRQLLTCGGTAPAGPLLPHAKRSIDVLISMSLTPASELEAMLAELPQLQRELVMAIVDETLDQPDVAVHDAGFRLLGPLGVEEWFAHPEANPGHLIFARNVFAAAYTQVHARRRLRLAPQLLQLPAVIHGHGWESVAVRGARASLRGATDFRTIQAMSARSRLVLNVMPPVNDAPHDRTFYAMLAGAAYLTDPNAFFRREYWEHDEILFFDLGTTSLVEQVDALLGDPARLAEVAEAGTRTTAERHTWRHRARELLAFAEEPALAG